MSLLTAAKAGLPVYLEAILNSVSNVLAIVFLVFYLALKPLPLSDADFISSPNIRDERPDIAD